jgi:hypothetical protein
MRLLDGAERLIEADAIGSFRSRLRGPLLQAGDSGYDEARAI